MKLRTDTFLRLLGCCGTFALASAGTLDQQYLPGAGGGLIIQKSQTVAQIFTVGASGLLDRVDVELARHAILAPQGITLELRSLLADGSPSATVLASAEIPANRMTTEYRFLPVDFTSKPVRVQIGDMLGLVLRSEIEDVATGANIDPFAWNGDTVGGYDGGKVYVDRFTGFLGNDVWDMGFKTYVDARISPVPESSMLGLGAAGALLLLVVARRCRAHRASAKQPVSPSLVHT